MRNRTKGICFAAALLALTACSGGGGSSPTAPEIRYVNVAGRWSGTWLAYGWLPLPMTMDLGQNGPNVSGTVFVTIGGRTFVFQTSSSVASVDSGGTGTLDFRVSDATGTFGGNLNVNGSSMNGYLTLAGGGDVISGPAQLARGGSAVQAAAEPAGIEELEAELRRMERR